jgi:hypothetical protein
MIYQTGWWVLDEKENILFHKNIATGRWGEYKGHLKGGRLCTTGCKTYESAEEFIAEHFEDFL